MAALQFDQPTPPQETPAKKEFGSMVSNEQWKKIGEETTARLNNLPGRIPIETLEPLAEMRAFDPQRFDQDFGHDMPGQWGSAKESAERVRQNDPVSYLEFARALKMLNPERFEKEVTPLSDQEWQGVINQMVLFVSGDKATNSSYIFTFLRRASTVKDLDPKRFDELMAKVPNFRGEIFPAIQRASQPLQPRGYAEVAAQLNNVLPSNYKQEPIRQGKWKEITMDMGGTVSGFSTGFEGKAQFFKTANAAAQLVHEVL